MHNESAVRQKRTKPKRSTKVVDTAGPHRSWFCPRCYATGVVDIETVPRSCPKLGCGQLLVSAIVLPKTRVVGQEIDRVFMAPPTRDEETEILAAGIPQEMIDRLFANRPSPDNPVTLTHRYVPSVEKKIDEITSEYDDRLAAAAAIETRSPQDYKQAIERLPLYVRDTWWALKFGAAWKVVKELRQMWEKKRTEYTPELAKSEQEKMQFLWRDFPDVAKELNLANGEQHSAPIQPAQRGAGQTTETLTDRDRTQAAKKMADKQRYPHMTAREISAAVGISLSVVYEHPDLENVPTGTRKRLWTTESVIKLKNSHPPE